MGFSFKRVFGCFGLGLALSLLFVVVIGLGHRAKATGGTLVLENRSEHVCRVTLHWQGAEDGPHSVPPGGRGEISLGLPVTDEASELTIEIIAGGDTHLSRVALRKTYPSLRVECSFDGNTLRLEPQPGVELVSGGR